MKNTMSMFAILGAAMLSACASKNGGGAAVQKPEIADKLNKLPNGTTFASSDGKVSLVKNTEGKWGYRFNAPGGTKFFALDEFQNEGDFDITKFKEYQEAGNTNQARFKVAHSDLTYGNYGLLEEIINEHGNTGKNYTGFYFAQNDKVVTYFTAPTQNVKFSGKTHAVLTTQAGTNSYKNLVGTAEMTINSGSTEGNLKFNYGTTWDKEITAKYDFATNNMVSWDVSGGLDKDPVVGHNYLKAKMLKDGSKEEVVGSYKFGMNDTQQGYVVDGAFGMKKE